MRCQELPRVGEVSCSVAFLLRDGVIVRLPILFAVVVTHLFVSIPRVCESRSYGENSSRSSGSGYPLTGSDRLTEARQFPHGQSVGRLLSLVLSAFCWSSDSSPPVDTLFVGRASRVVFADRDCDCWESWSEVTVLHRDSSDKWRN